MDNSEQIPGGATLWARQTIDSEIFYDKPDSWFKIWFYLVNRVNHKQKRKWGRGECFLNYKEINKYTKASHSTIDHCIRWLKSANMLATQKATRGMHIKILKYDYFQTLDNYYYDIKSDTKATDLAKEERYRGDTKNKNDKNDKNNIPSKVKKSEYAYGVDKLGRTIYLKDGNYRVKGDDGEFYYFGGDINEITKI